MPAIPLDEAVRVLNERLDRQVLRLLSAQEVFVGVLALILVVAAASLVFDRQAMRQDAREALERAYGDIGRAKADMDRALVGIAQMEQRLASLLDSVPPAHAEAHQASRLASEALASLEKFKDRLLGPLRDEIARAWDSLPDMDRRWVLGSERPPVPTDVSIAFVELDQVLVISDRFGWLRESPDGPDYFLKFGRYWRRLGEYPRARARFERASELAPASAEIQLQLSKTFAFQAADMDAGDTRRVDLLVRAQRHLDEAHKLNGGQYDFGLLHHLAWLRDEQGDYQAAVSAYEAAMGIMQVEGDRDKLAAVGYNLACSLWKAGLFDRALAQLAAALIDESRVCHAEEDDDFFSLDVDLKARFDQLLKERRQAVGLPPREASTAEGLRTPSSPSAEPAQSGSSAASVPPPEETSGLS